MIKIKRNGIIKNVTEKEFENKFKKYGFVKIEKEKKLNEVKEESKEESKDEIDINKTKKELFDLAKIKGLKPNYTMSKEALIKMLAGIE